MDRKGHQRVGANRSAFDAPRWRKDVSDICGQSPVADSINSPFRNNNLVTAQLVYI